MNRAIMFLIALTITAHPGRAQNGSAVEIRIPDIPGYRTLLCDFHAHTVFSDGAVWPSFRIEEAWRDGLDAIAITDHVEYLPKKEYLRGNRNTSIEIARATAKELDIILIPGAEITRRMPPGHLNALFITDAEALMKDDWREAVRETGRQGGLLMWNHPGWRSQQPDGIARWYDEHTEVLQTGLLAGMEVVNVDDYYPEVFQWCLDKEIAVMGNSDTHDPIKTEFNEWKLEHRPLTLVFAAERSSEAIRDAVVEGRTAVYSRHQLFGKEEYLRALVQASLVWRGTSFAASGRERVRQFVTNTSDIPFELVLHRQDDAVDLPREITLDPGRTSIFSIRARQDSLNIARTIHAQYEVKNCFVRPGRNLLIEFPLDVRIVGTKP